MARQKSGISILSAQRMVNSKSYKTVWVMGHEIREARAHRDAAYTLAGLIKIDDTPFGASKPGKRGRGAAGKKSVVVAVETKDNKAGFATMQQVERLSGDEIFTQMRDHLQGDYVVRTDGWPSYDIFNSTEGHHQPVVVGSGRNAVNLLPWVHTLIANVKGNIRGVYHDVSSKHLGRYLAEFCYPVNRRLGIPIVRSSLDSLSTLFNRYICGAKGISE